MTMYSTDLQTNNQVERKRFKKHEYSAHNAASLAEFNDEGTYDPQRLISCDITLLMARIQVAINHDVFRSQCKHMQ